MYKINGKRCWNSRGAAAILCIGRNNMLAELRAKGVLDHNNVPTKNYKDSDYFVVKYGEKFNTLVTYYTEEGVEYLKNICKDIPRKVVKITEYSFSDPTISEVDPGVTQDDSASLQNCIELSDVAEFADDSPVSHYELGGRILCKTCARKELKNDRTFTLDQSGEFVKAVPHINGIFKHEVKEMVHCSSCCDLINQFLE